MSPPAMMSRIGFLDLPTSLEPKHAKAITHARERAEGAMSHLREFAETWRADSELSETGRTNRLRAGLVEAGRFVVAVFDEAKKVIEADRDTATYALQGRLWAGVNADRLAPAQGSLLALLQRDPVPSQLPTDERGHAVLPACGRALSGLAELVRSAPVDDARLVVLASLRADPITRFALGGEPVLKALTRAVTDRVVASDPDAARHKRDIEAADALLSGIEGDQRAAIEGAARALGLPKEAAHAINRPDPIADAAKRRAS